MPSFQSHRPPPDSAKPPALHLALPMGPAMSLNPSPVSHHSITLSPSRSWTLTSPPMRLQLAPTNLCSRGPSSASTAESSNVSRSSQLTTPSLVPAITLSPFLNRATSLHLSRRLAKLSTLPTSLPKNSPASSAMGLPSHSVNPPSSPASSKEFYATVYSSACKRR